MAGTPEGHDFMVNKAGMIPAFKSIRLSAPGPFSKAVQDWMAQGKIYNWQQYKLPDGFGMDTLGPIFTEMAAGRINTQQFVTQFTAAVAGIRR
jgi:raffinose/stachyose/melibiose transport system substrate-binding protein